MKKLTPIILIPIAIAANININIIASKDQAIRHSHASGSEVSVIDNIELETFQLYDGKLKDAIKTYFGEKPDDVYLKSRTPWGDLYPTYGWSPVYRTLTPVKTEIFFVEYNPVEISTRYFNTSMKEVINKITIREEVENTAKSIWRINGELAGVNIHYDVNIKETFGESSFNYDAKWGEEVMKSQTINIGPEKELEVPLKSGQRAKAVLIGTKGELKVRINYEATLTGTIAVNYNDSFKGHHFYAMDIYAVLTAGKLNATVNFVEDLTIKYFSDYEVIVKDVDTNEIIKYT